MSEFINTIDQLGDEVVLQSMIDRTITEFKDNVLTKIGWGAFNNCKNLTTVDLPNVTSMDAHAFNGCSNLNTLILRSETLCLLINTVVLNNTPIAKGSGNVYVNDNLVDTYKSATNWSTFANQIKGVSELGG